MNRIFLGITAAAIAAAAAPLIAQSETSSEDSRRGKQLYQAVGCWQCHGTIGHGGGWQGPPLAPDPLPLPAFLAQLRSPVNSMPRYGAAVLSDQDVANIHAFLRSVVDSRRASDIPALRGDSGLASQPATAIASNSNVFDQCATCHGEDGAGSALGPSLRGIIDGQAGRDPNFAYSPAIRSAGPWSREALIEFLVSPKDAVPGNRMAYEGAGTREKAISIVEHLETLR